MHRFEIHNRKGEMIAEGVVYSTGTTAVHQLTDSPPSTMVWTTYDEAIDAHEDGRRGHKIVMLDKGEIPRPKATIPDEAPEPADSDQPEDGSVPEGEDA